MRTCFYADDFNREKMVPATLESALVDVADIAAEVSRYGGNLATFAYSIDAVDHVGPEGLRNCLRLMSWNVAVGNLSDNEIAQIHAALAFVCSGDEWAAEKIAGAFKRTVRRVQVLRAIGRHRRASQFYTLCEAIERGRFTAKQWAFALKLAAEAPPEAAEAA